ncbi:LOW QUALITY PROTEIN: uncharacterized protein LOC125334712 [Corvus hawaiiensis]|uniref:LOW QUALITY PROTEIN: uncharacterized protein LOC125334712 n=1 Tax=Corvus hawaiiensis TaxID=134902 RepID=UPI002019C988|nr:LOW QUALITY PROTEIN: uncharacterized protein LOC125334712 [Corvus hawaiiensis]
MHLAYLILTVFLGQLLVAVARAQVQQEPRLETTENTGINISCSHPKIQTGESIYWYRHLPGRGPEFLALIVKESKELPDIAGGLWVSADRRSSALWLRRPRRGDAAVYYCALGTRAEEPGLRPGTNRRGRASSSGEGPSAIVAPGNARRVTAPGGDGRSASAEDAANISRGGGSHGGGKELRMGPGRLITTGEGWMATVESWHCRTQGSLQLFAGGVGPQGWQGQHGV